MDYDKYFDEMTREVRIVLSKEGVIAFICENSSIGRDFVGMFPIGTHLTDVILEQDKKRFEKSFKRCVHNKSQATLEFKLVTPNRFLIAIEALIKIVDDTILLNGIVNTEDQFSNLALKEIQSISKTGAWYYVPVTQGLFWSDETFSIHGYQIPCDIDTNVALSFYMDAYKDVVASKSQELFTKGTSYNIIAQIKSKRGKIKWVHSSGNAILHNNEVLLAYGFVQDIDKRHKHILQLKNNDEVKTMALKGIKSGLFDHNLSNDEVLYSTHFKKMLGLPITEGTIPEALFRQLLHPEDQDDAYERHLKGLLASGHLYTNYYRLKNNKNEYRHYEVHGWRKKDSEGNTVRMIGNLIDVHDKVINERLKNQYLGQMEAMVNNGFTNSILLDTEGTIQLADNESARVAKEFSGKDILNEPCKFLDVMPPNFRNSFQKEFERALSGISIRKEIDRISYTGGHHWMEIIYTPVEDQHGTITAVLLNFHDITEMKKALISTRKAKLESEELSALKTNIISKLNHEIRTPLNGIISISELLKEENLEPHERSKLLEMLDTSNLRLSNTLDSLLRLKSVASSREFVKERLHIQKVLKSCLLEFKHIIEAKGLLLQFDASRYDYIIEGNYEYLHASIEAILSNAIKFTQKGSISVGIRYDREKNVAVINVKDTGIGIKSHNLSKVFQSFVQESDGYGRLYEGTGLGLSIAKRYILSMNGDIQVASIEGKGSNFEIVLPVCEVINFSHLV